MLIPSKDFWQREQFLAARGRQTEAAKAKGPPEALAELDCEHHVIDMGDKILCDSCNAVISDAIINLVEFGRRVACDECYQRLYANEEIVYRYLRPDGGLGPIAKKTR